MPPLQTMKIGTLARRSGRSIHTLRYYEAQRLMPNVNRDPAGRRIYTERHIDWLEFLALLRHTGMTIAQMRAYTALVAQGDPTLSQRRTFLLAHRARVAAMVKQLGESLVALDHKLALYLRWIKAGGSPRRPRR